MNEMTLSIFRTTSLPPSQKQIKSCRSLKALHSDTKTCTPHLEPLLHDLYYVGLTLETLARILCMDEAVTLVAPEDAEMLAMKKDLNMA